ncbi:apolipoprotein N-acyltransferase [Candidatus Marinarcus aquaticus]|uniref:Apolipoprotein N-acyltransferase n=1 Tax=Candidatus Marinarcus aquaticus TaxID=2044504 RepID=A0A4Q0XPT8_9BACT|nr:apolipoprotein N-acyltransferase [Candidatus Marinarcus aquaticus]RXJ57568.1 apolipoprotein N-acyltransferase [Candidatus Marinarcus aquaticus]
MFLIKRINSNKTNIIKGLYTSFFFSAFIYLSLFEIEFKLLHTLLALLAIYHFLRVPRQALFMAGFFVGILWFYWVGFSFTYYELAYLIPLVILGFALFYGFLFFACTIIDNIIFRSLALIGLSFLEPFGFNWFNPELLFVHSYFDIDKLSFMLIVLSMAMVTQFRLIALIPLVFAVQFGTPTMITSKLDIAMPQLEIAQEQKWKRSNLNKIIELNLTLIDNAIWEDKELIILPETTLPLLLNQNDVLLDKLKEKSFYIEIVLGSLFKEGELYHNSTYHFSQGKMSVANKVVLVPFGEAVPLPEVLRNFINDTFYNGAKDYTRATAPTDFNIKGESFRNAICYETTTHEIFENLNGVKQMISISNNAWFTPSIEPVLQKLLMKYYARLYGVTIYAVANGSENAIITP